jgi:hypothetical protein
MFRQSSPFRWSSGDGSAAIHVVPDESFDDWVVRDHRG